MAMGRRRLLAGAVAALAVLAGPAAWAPKPAGAQTPAESAVRLRITNIFTFPDTTGVVLSATAAAHDVRLNDAGGLVMVDDLGNRHRLVPPPDNPLMAIPAGQTRQFDLEFIGPVSRRATTLVLTTNTGPPPGDPAAPVITLTIPAEGLHD